MKRMSVKGRIVLWLVALMALLEGIMLIVMGFMGSAAITRTAEKTLEQTVRSSLTQIHPSGQGLELGADFQFYRSGVSTLIYSGNQTLLAGQIPVSFTAEEPFQNGLLRAVSSGDTQYLVLDLWMPQGWEGGLWVRGLMEAPESRPTVRNLLLVGLLSMPGFIGLAALGGYLILRRSFRPLNRITATAADINEARDLSRRIGLPPGRDEFSRLAATFDDLFERLERSFELEEQFTADASHELRTPVSVIKGACEYGLKYDETEEERQETLTMIRRQAEHMTGLISQLLSITRLDQGTETIRFQTLDLGVLAEALCEEQEWDPARLSLDIRQETVVQGDPVLLRRLLGNLVDNAFKYGKPDGHVWLTVSRQGGEVLAAVRDDGMGIPREQQERIWQRFYQVDPSRGSDSGAGLGLAMVRQIAGAHGGYMTLESIVDVGSVFTLHLPASDGAPAGEAGGTGAEKSAADGRRRAENGPQ